MNVIEEAEKVVKGLTKSKKWGWLLLAVAAICLISMIYYSLKVLRAFIPRKDWSFYYPRIRIKDFYFPKSK